MDIKKLFFPIGGGEDIEARIRGALLVNKAFNSHIKFLASQMDFNLVFNMEMALRSGKIFDALHDSVADELKAQKDKNHELFTRLCGELGVQISDTNLPGIATAEFVTKEGLRSKVVEYEAKFCDLVVSVCPPEGEPTATFNASVIKSGKNAIVIPRNLKEFKTDRILIGWSGTANIAKAITGSMFLLKQAKSVHIITTARYMQDAPSIQDDLLKYLSFHDVNATFEVVKTTSTHGEALLNNTQNGHFDMVVASSSGENGLREMYLGGTTKYFLQNTPVPVFV